jgi:putative ABC transport system permease protein
MLNDVRLAGRMLLKDRGFTAAAVVILALGIAATTTIFTFVNALLLRPLPFSEATRLVEMGEEVSFLDFQDWRSALRSFDGIAAAEETPTHVSGDDRAAERVGGALVSANAFALLGVAPMLGRDFREEDDRDGAPPVAILSHELWRTRYGSDADVLGRTIRINGVASTVIGVMPDGFLFPENARVWRPLTMLPAELKQSRTAHALDVFGRVRGGVAHGQAQAELRTVASRLGKLYPDEDRDLRPRVALYRGGIDAGTPAARIFLLMMGAVVFVLLIACANVANLQLARAAARMRDVSVRISIGASRWRVVRQLLVESALLSLIGGAAALGLSAVAIRLFATAFTAGVAPPYWMQFTLDARVLVVFAFVCLGTTIVFGLVPAVQASSVNIADLLNRAGRGATSHRQTGRWTGALVVAQLALSLVLLAGAGAVVRNLIELARNDTGVDTRTLVTTSITLPAPRYESPERRLQFVRDLDDRLAGVPGFRAALAAAMPGGDAPEVPILTDRGAEFERRTFTARVSIGSRYFETVGVPLRRGRLFDARLDGAGGAVVNERFVELHLPDGEPLGRRFRAGRDGDWLTVIGVVGNVRQNRSDISGAFEPVVYVPFAGDTPRDAYVLVRAPGGLPAALAALRDAVRDVDSDMPVYDIRTVAEAISQEQWAPRLFGSMFSIFAGIAVVLAAVGLYGVTAYAATLRRREIGLRVALGAQARQIGWLVSRRAARQIATGLLIGGAGAAAVSRALPGLVFGEAQLDPVTVGAVATLLAAISALACAVPARRAIRLDPVAALRAE